MRILLLVNDCRVAEKLAAIGYRPEIASDGADLDGRARSADYDILIVDLELLDDGLALVKAWRRGRMDAHILVLTASTAETILALNCGADAALPRPCAVAELLARVRVAARRRRPGRPWVLRLGDLEINHATRSVKRADQVVYLTAQQFRLFWCLARRPGDVVTYPELQTHLGTQPKNASNHVAVVVRYLRSKLDKAFNVRLIHTIWKKGYMMPNVACAATPARATVPTMPA